MSADIPEIGSATFAQARRAERAAAALARQSRAALALAALHQARDTFVAQAAEVYAGGADAAASDADLLEEIADQLAAGLEALHPTFERLDLARDLAIPGRVLSRARSRYDVARLAVMTAELFADEMLSPSAGAVLLAAMRRRAGQIC